MVAFSCWSGCWSTGEFVSWSTSIGEDRSLPFNDFEGAGTEMSLDYPLAVSGGKARDTPAFWGLAVFLVIVSAGGIQAAYSCSNRSSAEVLGFSFVVEESDKEDAAGVLFVGDRGLVADTALDELGPGRC